MATEALTNELEEAQVMPMRKVANLRSLAKPSIGRLCTPRVEERRGSGPKGG